ncbi:MAG: lytic murein transglycosylase, partial [Proteobacteria bacterium]|nr:lytic murein transglycosylase [Candidatus Enterousia avistercoris]
MKHKHFLARTVGVMMICMLPHVAFCDDRGVFDMARWDAILDDVRTRAVAANISEDTIRATLKSPAFIPSIVHSDKNQSEFKLTLDGYLARTVNSRRIENGHKMRATYPTMLNRVYEKYGVQPHVILAFWGLESNYGTYHAAHRLKDAFFTLMYEGRRQTFFGNQLLALMKIADDNRLDINDIYGSWAGAMGHFQFIPTTLAQYGADGNGDGKIDIIHSVGDAMFSAGNYLSRLGWNPNERIVRRVALPADFDITLLDGKTKKPLTEWAAMGVLNDDGS